MNILIFMKIHSIFINKKNQINEDYGFAIPHIPPHIPHMMVAMARKVKCGLGPLIQFSYLIGLINGKTDKNNYDKFSAAMETRSNSFNNL